MCRRKEKSMTLQSGWVAPGIFLLTVKTINRKHKRSLWVAGRWLRLLRLQRRQGALRHTRSSVVWGRCSPRGRAWPGPASGGRQACALPTRGGHGGAPPHCPRHRLATRPGEVPAPQGVLGPRGESRPGLRPSLTWALQLALYSDGAGRAESPVCAGPVPGVTQGRRIRGERTPHGQRGPARANFTHALPRRHRPEQLSTDPKTQQEFMAERRLTERNAARALMRVP